MRATIIPQDVSIKKPFFWGLSACVISFITVGIFWNSLPPEIPLFFSKPRSDAQLASRIFLLLPSVLALVLLFLNSIFLQTFQQSVLLKRMLILGATTACILAGITVVRIIFLVI